MPQVSVKSRIVEHAERVFREKGFNGASVQDITTAAGVPKGSFYNHFGSKQALAAEIVTRYAEATDVRSLFDERVPALEALRDHLERQIERTVGTGLKFGCLLGGFATDTIAGDPVAEAVRAAYATWTEAVGTAVRRGQAAGDVLDGRSAEELATYLIDGFEGATLRARNAEDVSVLTTYVDIALESIAGPKI